MGRMPCLGMAALLLSGIPVTAASQDQTSPLAPLAFLAGSCWQATLPGGQGIDQHCFDWDEHGMRLRDRHTVRDARSTYRGESVYHFDAARGSIVFSYQASDGTAGQGTAVPIAEGLEFPAHRYRTGDRETEVRSRWRRVAPDRYGVHTEVRKGDAWTDLWRVEYIRSGPTTGAAAPLAPELEALKPLLGTWAPPAEDVSARPELTAYRQVLTPGGHAGLVQVREGYRLGLADAPAVEGLIAWHPLQEALVFSAKHVQGWVFEGRYAVGADGRLQRTYDVSYPRNRELIPEPALDGWTRRFREIYTLAAPDRLDVQLDIWKDGAWRPFGTTGGRYRLVRVDGGR